MKDKNGIEIKCENCAHKGLLLNPPGDCALCPNLEFIPSPEAYEARIADLKEERALLKENFTIEEIDFIKKAISMAILDCETNSPKPSEVQLKLMWSIKSKCDELLKESVNNE